MAVDRTAAIAIRLSLERLLQDELFSRISSPEESVLALIADRGTPLASLQLSIKLL